MKWTGKCSRNYKKINWIRIEFGLGESKAISVEKKCDSQKEQHFKHVGISTKVVSWKGLNE